jgi:predicted small lipoprotein YifL
MKIAVLLVLLCLGLGACGQKGPLYLPQPNKPLPTDSQTGSAPQTESAQPKAEQPQTEPAKTNQPATPAE